MPSTAPLSSALLIAALTACNPMPRQAQLGITPDPATTSDDLLLDLVLNSDDEARADDLDIRIRWTNNGQLQDDLSDRLDVPWGRTQKGDIWQASVTLISANKRSEPQNVSTAIVNTSPVAQIELPGATSAGADIVATPKAIDADNDTFAYRWSWTQNDLPTEFTTKTIPSSATAPDDVWTATLIINDGTEDSDPVSASTSVGNIAPEITDLTVSPSQVYTSDSLEAIAVASDANDNPITLLFEWSVDGQVVQSSADNTLDSALFTKNQRITLSVTPNDGFIDGESQSATPMTVLNSPPLIAAAQINLGDLYSSDSPLCTVAGWSDLDGDPKLIRFEWFVNDSPVSTEAQLQNDLFVKGDSVYCQATPFDGDEVGPTLQTDTIVVLNSAPTIDELILSNLAPALGESISVDIVNPVDADGDPITFSYRWFVNGAEFANTEVLDGSTLSLDDTAIVFVTPSDGVDAGVELSSAQATVLNQPPVISSGSILPAVAYTNTDLGIQFSASDLENNAITYAYEWSKNDQPFGFSVSVASSTFVKGDVIGLTIKASDAYGEGTPFVVEPITIQNSLPSISHVTLSTTSAQEADTVDCLPSGWADIDPSDQPSYTFEWTVNDLVVATTSQISGDLFAKGDTYQCSATPTNPEGLGTPLNSSVGTATDTAPTIGGVTLSSTGPLTTDTLSATIDNPVDLDGDPISYAYDWTVNGVSVAITDTLNGSFFTRGQDVVLTVTPSAAGVTGLAVSSPTATVLNTAPVINAASVQPANPLTTDTLSVLIDAIDADGDSVGYTYDWTVNGGAVSTNATLDPNLFVRGDAIEVSVLPSDGTLDGASVIASGTIQNSPPHAPVIEITPSPVLLSDDLYCLVSQEATDDDGDPTSYTFSWMVDAVDYTGAVLTTSHTGDSVAGSVTALGEQWTCSVLTTDGTDTSSVSAQVLIRDKNGSSSTQAGLSCQQILLDFPSSPTGLYWLDPTGGGASFEGYCEMTIFGGGWTLILNLDTNDGTVREYDDTVFWTSATTVGSPASAMTADFKSEAYNTLSGSELMIEAHNNGVEYGSAGYQLVSPAINSTFFQIFGFAADTPITDVRQSVQGDVPTFGVRNGGDAFIQNPHAVVVNSTYSPVDSVNLTRLGTHYTDICPPSPPPIPPNIINCNGHNYGGLGGRHSRSIWATRYEAAALNGYCPGSGSYGTDALPIPGFAKDAFSGCHTGTPADAININMAIFVR